MTIEARRAVLIQWDRDGSRRRGSGLRIADRFVLTADHCANGDNHTVYLDGVEHAATLHVRSGTADVDLALFEVPDLDPVAPLGIAQVDRTVVATVEDCVAMGFPRWKNAGGQASLVQSRGKIPTAEGIMPTAGDAARETLTLKLSDPQIRDHPITAGEIDQTGWAGMSGAVVLTADDLVVAVVRSHALAEGVGSLTVTPISTINRLTDIRADRFWKALQVTNPLALPVVPAPTVDESRRPAEQVPPSLVPAPPDFTPRPWAVEEVARWYDSPARYLLLTGDHGAGKSVLCAWLAGQGGQGLTPDLERLRAGWSAVHFCSGSTLGTSTDPQDFAESLRRQLLRTVPGFARPGEARGTGVELLRGAGASVVEAFKATVESPLARALTRAGAAPAVVLVDGIDEAGDGADGILELVRRLARVDAGVRLVLSGPEDQDLRRLLGGLPGGLGLVELSSGVSRPRVDRDIEAFVRSAVDRAPRDHVEDTTIARIVRAAGGNFLYADHAVDGLADLPAGATDGIDLPVGLAASYDAHLRRVLARVLGTGWLDRWSERIEPLLGLLAVTEAPVARSELEDWLGWSSPELRTVLERLDQLVHVDGDLVGLYHPTLGTFLRSSTIDAAGDNTLQVDVATAHRRIAEAFASPDPAHAEHGPYALVHGPHHLLALGKVGSDLVDKVTERALDPSYLAELTERVGDAVRRSRPFRDVGAVLRAARRTDGLERLVRVTAGAADLPLRAVAFDVLGEYAALDERAAATFMADLAVGTDENLPAIALHATCRLEPQRQVAVFTHVLNHDRSDRGLPLQQAAAFALYANDTLDSQRVIDEVLNAMVAEISARRPLQMRPLLKFFTLVTVTNYINGCGDPQVVEATGRLWRHVLHDRLRIGLLNHRALEVVALEPLARHLAAMVLEAVEGRSPHGTRLQYGRAAPGAQEAEPVIAALDPAVPFAPVADAVLRLLDGPTPALRVLGALVVGAHAVTDAPGTLSVLGRLADQTGERGRRWLLAALSVVMSGTPPQWVPFLEATTRRVTTSDAVVVRDQVLSEQDMTLVPLALAYAKAGLPMSVHTELLTTGGPTSEGWRARTVDSLGVVGLYFPAAALTTFDHLLDTGAITHAEAVHALRITAGLHPLRVGAWRTDRPDAEVLGPVAADVTLARRYLETLGHYNNAVNQAVRLPKMRESLCKGVFTTFLDSRSQTDWRNRYARVGLKVLRETEYDPIRLTEP